MRPGEISVMRRLGLAAGMWGALAMPASAYDIVDREVDRGQQMLETMHVALQGFPGGSIGNTRNLQSLAYTYGLTDYWQFKGGIVGDRHDDRDWQVTTVFAETVLEFVDAKKTGIGFGWFTGIGGAVYHDTTNVTTFGPIIKFAHQAVSLTLNPFFEKTFGQNREPGMAFAYGWQASVDMKKGVTLSLAGFGHIANIGGHTPAFEAQEHKIGPLIGFEAEVAENRTLGLEMGVFFGLTDATADTAVKAKLSYTY
jgi:hypothetical protein